VAARADANGDQTIPAYHHTHGHGNEDRVTGQDRDASSNDDDNTDRFPDTHSDKYTTGAGADINFRTGLSGLRAVQNSDVYCDGYAAADRDSDAGSASNGNEYAVSSSDLYSHAIIHADAHAVSDSDLYAHTDANCDANTVSNSNLYPHAVAHTDTYVDAHAIPYDDEEGNAFPDADANLHSYAAAISIPVV
jgi:hypothetical protein